MDSWIIPEQQSKLDLSRSYEVYFFLKNLSSDKFPFHVSPASLHNCYEFDVVEIRNCISYKTYIYIYRSIDAPALIPLNLCDFLRDPKGQL